MAKGDQVEVIMQVGDKVERFKIVASRNGEKVVVDRPRTGDDITITVENRNEVPGRTLSFSKRAVLGVIETPVGRNG